MRAGPGVPPGSAPWGERFVAAYTRLLESLHSRGARATLEALDASAG